VGRIPSQRSLNDAGIRWRATIDQSQVLFLYFPIGKLGLEPTVGRVILGHQDQTRRALVQAVNHPRSTLAPHAFQLGCMCQGGVNEGSPLVTGRGMHHHTRRLIDHQQVIIFIDDIERNRFGFDVGRLDFGNRGFDPFPAG
jgi:hypothetical protein